MGLKRREFITIAAGAAILPRPALAGRDREHVVTGTAATPTALMSRIELYGILLGEVAGIRSNLVAYLTCTRTEGKIPMQMECVNRKSLQEGSSP